MKSQFEIETEKAGGSVVLNSVTRGIGNKLESA